MRLVFLAILAAGGSASAQTVVNPARLNPALRGFDRTPGETALKCEVSRIPASLNFAFRFQAGYVVRVPMNQYLGSGHNWAVLIRVTPEQGGQPVYLVDRIRLPEVPKTRVQADFGGVYLVGEGRYRVDWKMVDNTGRVCRDKWSFEAKRRGDERKATVAMAPGAVTDVTLRGSARVQHPPDDARPFRLTVLLHAAPTFPRRTRLSVRDRVMLTSTLASLLERLPTKSVRLVAFSLDQQKELFRQDDFGLSGLGQVARAINETEMGTVDYQVLANRRGHTNLMAQLLNAELNHENPSDVVLVLGGPSRYFDKLPDGVLERSPGSATQFFFLQYAPMFRMQATLPDTIAMALSKLRAKTVWIRTPGDFAKAIELIERRVSAAN